MVSRTPSRADALRLLAAAAAVDHPGAIAKVDGGQPHDAVGQSCGTRMTLVKPPAI